MGIYTCFIVHWPQFSMTQAQRRLGVAQPEVTGGSPNSRLVGVVVIIEDYHSCHLYNTFVSFYSYLSSGQIHVPIFTETQGIRYHMVKLRTASTNLWYAWPDRVLSSRILTTTILTTKISMTIRARMTIRGHAFFIIRIKTANQ